MEKELRYLQRVIQELSAETHYAIQRGNFERAMGLMYALKHFVERRDWYLEPVRFALLKEEKEDAEQQ
jgi:hypothetical protein